MSHDTPPPRSGLLRVVNLLGFVVLGLLAVAAYEAGSSVTVWREPRRIHAELRPKTRPGVENPLEVQIEIRRLYQRPGFLLPWLAPYPPRPDTQVVEVDLDAWERGARRLVVDAEAGAAGKAERPPARRVYPDPGGVLEEGTGTWPLVPGELEVRVTKPASTYRVELWQKTDDGERTLLLHEVDEARGEVQPDVLGEQMAAPVRRR